MIDYLSSYFNDFLFNSNNHLPFVAIGEFLAFMLALSFIYMFLKLIFPNVSKYRNFVFGVIIILSVIMFVFYTFGFDIYLAEYLTYLQEKNQILIDYLSNIGNTQTLALLGGV